jgi:hypothetical protein
MCASCERFFCGRVGRKNEIEGIARDTRATIAGMLLQQRAHSLDGAKVNAPFSPSHQLFTHQFYGIVFPCRKELACPRLTRFSAGDFEKIATVCECDLKSYFARMRDERANGCIAIFLQLDPYRSPRRIFQFDTISARSIPNFPAQLRGEPTDKENRG